MKTGIVFKIDGRKSIVLKADGSFASVSTRSGWKVGETVSVSETSSAGVKIGYLPQEPELDAEKTVREEVRSGMGDVMAAQKRLDEVYAAYAEPDADFDALAEEQAKLEAIIATGAGDNTSLQLEIAADALRLPAWDAKIGHLSGVSAAWRYAKLLLSKPDMLLLDEPISHFRC